MHQTVTQLLMFLVTAVGILCNYNGVGTAEEIKFFDSLERNSKRRLLIKSSKIESSLSSTIAPTIVPLTQSPSSERKDFDLCDHTDSIPMLRWGGSDDSSIKRKQSKSKASKSSKKSSSQASSSKHSTSSPLIEPEGPLTGCSFKVTSAPAHSQLKSKSIKSTKTSKTSKSTKKSSKSSKKSSKSGSKSSKKSSKSHKSLDHRTEPPSVAPTDPLHDKDVVISPSPSLAPSKKPTTSPSTSVPSENAFSGRDLEVCKCDESNICNDKPLPQGSDLRLCFVRVSSTKSIQVIQNLRLEQGLVAVDIVLAGLQVDSEAVISCDVLRQNCFVTTRVIDEFYAQEGPRDVLATGTAVIGSESSNSIMREEETTRQLILDQVEVNFSETIQLEKSKDSDLPSGIVKSSGSGKSAKAIPIGAFVGTVAVVATGGLAYALFKGQNVASGGTMAEV